MSDPLFQINFMLPDGEHVMVATGPRSMPEIEAHAKIMVEARNKANPEAPMRVIGIKVVQSPDQIDKEVARLRAATPGRMLACDLYPDNPNAILFPPLTGERSARKSADPLIDAMIDGTIRF